jgi:hypothetical protein
VDGLFAKVNWPMVILAAMVLLAGTAVSAKLAFIKVQPPPLPGRAGQGTPGGLGGWLALVGIGICLSPLGILRTIIPIAQAYWDSEVWMSLTDPASADYLAWYAVAAPIEMILNCTMLVLNFLLVFLYFAKRRTFRPAFIAFCALQLLVLLYEFVLGKIDPRYASSDLQMALTLAKWIVWVSYLCLSVRVKNTFAR